MPKSGIQFIHGEGILINVLVEVSLPFSVSGQSPVEQPLLSGSHLLSNDCT